MAQFLDHYKTIYIFCFLFVYFSELYFSKRFFLSQLNFYICSSDCSIFFYMNIRIEKYFQFFYFHELFNFLNS